MKRVGLGLPLIAGLVAALSFACGDIGTAQTTTPTPNASAVSATARAASALETRVAAAVEATLQARENRDAADSTPTADTTVTVARCTQDSDCSVGGVCINELCASVPEPTPTEFPACFVNNDCPLGTICQGGVCVPGAAQNLRVEYWNVPVALDELQCVDFSPGVPPLTGPTRWYDVTGFFISPVAQVTSLLMRVEIIDATGRVLSEATSPGLNVPPNTQWGFSEQVDLPSAPEGSQCRVTFTDSGFERSRSGAVTTSVVQLFAP